MSETDARSPWNSRRLIPLALVLGLVAFALVRERSIQAKAVEAVSAPFFGVMGTDGRLTVMARDPAAAEAALADAIGRIKDVDRLMSVFRPDSDVSQANERAADEPVPLSPETAECLAVALQAAEWTGGAFDITVKPLVNLWAESGKKGALPSPEQVAEAKERVGHEAVSLDEETPAVRFARPGVEIDLGGVAKGYAVDLAYRALAEQGFPDALVDAGGDLYAGGTRGGRPWRVGIQDPRAEKHDPPSAVLVLEVSDRAVATSGNYRRYSIVEGQRISHILDPRTGRPADAVPSATVVARDCATADALATGISVLALEEGLALVNALPDVEALLMTIEDGELRFHRSEGFSRYEADAGSGRR